MPAPSPALTSARYLQGKGVFVTHDAIGAGSRGEREWDDLAACGVRWVALQVAWHRSAGVRPVRPELTRNAARLSAEVYAATRRGFAVWLWGWPVPSRVDDFARTVAEATRTLAEAPSPTGAFGAVGWILNVETAEPGGTRAWAEGSEGAAAELLTAVREAQAGPVYLTTHGRLTRRQPWRVFATADGVLPQVYDPDCAYGAGGDGSTFASRCADSYREAFAGRQVVPLLGANSTPAPCMARLARDAAAVADGALGWWAWTTLRSSAEKRAIVAAARLPQDAPPNA